MNQATGEHFNPTGLGSDQSTARFAILLYVSGFGCGLIYLWSKQQNVWYLMQPYTMKQKLRDTRLRARVELYNKNCLWERNVNFAKNVNFQLRAVQYFHCFG